MKRLLAMIVLLCLICIQVSAPCLAFEELSKGSKGDAVVELQNRLNELGYSVGKPDGDYGGKTEKAVKKFQADNDLDVTGIVDESTYHALFDDDASIDEVNSDAKENETIAFSKDHIIDLWFANRGVIIHTDDGNVWHIDSSHDSEELEVYNIATDVKTVFHSDYGTESLFIHNDDSIEFNTTSYKQDYELDDEWHDIVLASLGSNHAVGLRTDGVWCAAGAYADGECDVDDWTDIIDVEVGWNHTVGLKSDGTVVATGNNDEGQCNVSSWTDIVQISTSGSVTMGLKSDGTVIATGNNDFGQCNVSDWADIVYISCGGSASFGLTGDGRLLTTMDSYFKGDKYARLIPRKYQCDNAVRMKGDASFWGDSKDPSGDGRILVIKSDNTIDVFGNNYYIRCEQLMDYINGSSATTDSGKAEEKADAKVDNNDEKLFSDLVAFDSTMMESISDQINKATDLTTTNNDRAILAALLSLEFVNQNPDFKYDYKKPIYVCKQGDIASVAMGGEKDYVVIIYQAHPLSTSYGYLYDATPQTAKAALEVTNEKVWTVDLNTYNEKLEAVVEQLQ